MHSNVFHIALEQKMMRVERITAFHETQALWVLLLRHRLEIRQEIFFGQLIHLVQHPLVPLLMPLLRHLPKETLFRQQPPLQCQLSSQRQFLIRLDFKRSMQVFLASGFRIISQLTLGSYEMILGFHPKRQQIHSVFLENDMPLQRCTMIRMVQNGQTKDNGFPPIYPSAYGIPGLDALSKARWIIWRFPIGVELSALYHRNSKRWRCSAIWLSTAMNSVEASLPRLGRYPCWRD